MVEYSGYPLLILTVILIPVQTICVILRLIIRSKSHMQFGWDDTTIILALASQLGWGGVVLGMSDLSRLSTIHTLNSTVITSLGAIKNSGLGYHTVYLQATNPQAIILEGKYRVAEGFLYVTGANLPKISILCLYRRLFPYTTLRTLSSMLIGVLTITMIVEIIVLSLACRPFAAFWNPFIHGSRCVDVAGAYAYGSIPNIVTDVVMLFLPAPVIWSLHTTTGTKIQLTITFACGSL